MQHNHARLIFILSIFLFSLVSLNFAKIASNTNQQANKTSEKKNLAEAVEEIGRVLPGTSQTYYYKFYLKDSSAASNITTTNQTDTSKISGATVTVTNKSSFHCGDSGSDYTFAELDSYYKLICQEAGEMKLAISKSGYTTRYTSISNYSGEIPTIYLTKATPKPPPAPPETIKNVNLPSKFKEAGSETTELSQVADPAKVDNLTLDTKLGKIKYAESVDLSASEVKDKFKELDKYVKIEQAGVIAVDSTSLPVLNKKANVTMKSLNFLKTPRVFVDGKENKEVVSNIRYANGVLTFDVTHFSTFTVAPTVGINEPANNFETKEKTVTLRGSVSDPTATVSAKLNNKDLGKLKVATDSGIFQKEIELSEGLNKLVVSALSSTGATSSATISGTLLKTASKLPLYFLLSVLAVIAAFSAVSSIKFMSKKMQKNIAEDQKKSVESEENSNDSIGQTPEVK